MESLGGCYRGSRSGVTLVVVAAASAVLLPAAAVVVLFWSVVHAVSSNLALRKEHRYKTMSRDLL